MLGGRLLETENKRIYQISCLKSARGRLRNLNSGRLWESFMNSIWQRNKTVIYKAVAYGRWSLTRSGRYERVDCITNVNVHSLSARQFLCTWRRRHTYVTVAVRVASYADLFFGSSRNLSKDCVTCLSLQPCRMVFRRVAYTFAHFLSSLYFNSRLVSPVLPPTDRFGLDKGVAPSPPKSW